MKHFLATSKKAVAGGIAAAATAVGPQFFGWFLGANAPATLAHSGTGDAAVDNEGH